MPVYCAFLGHQPHISLAELCTLLPDAKIQKQWSPKIVTFETKEDLNSEWMNLTGGIVLVAQEITTAGPAKKDKRHRLHPIHPLYEPSPALHERQTHPNFFGMQ